MSEPGGKRVGGISEKDFLGRQLSLISVLKNEQDMTAGRVRERASQALCTDVQK